MLVFLSESDVQAALSMSGTVAVVEAAFRDLGSGGATLLPRVSQILPGTAGMFRILAATFPSQHVFGLKTLTGFPGRRLAGEVYFAVLLFEMGSGALRAVISANHLTGMRTGAASGVAAKYLAREDATSLGVIGTGLQAWFQVESLAAVREIRTAKVFSRDAAKAAAFAARVQQRYSIEAVAVESAEETIVVPRGQDGRKVLLAHALHDVSGLRVTSLEDASRVIAKIPSTLRWRMWVVYRGTSPTKGITKQEGFTKHRSTRRTTSG